MRDFLEILSVWLIRTIMWVALLFIIYWGMKSYV
jgi:hypothetical protein